MKPSYANVVSQDVKRIPNLPETPIAFARYVLRHCSARMKKHAFGAWFFIAVANVLDTLTVWILGRIVSAILENENDFWAPVLREIGWLALIWLARNLALRGMDLCERIYNPELSNMTRALMFNRLIQHSQNFLHSNFAGVLANHVRRTSEVLTDLALRIQHNIIPLIVRFVTSGVLLWAITPILPLFLLVFFLVAVVAGIWLAPRLGKLSRDAAEYYSQMSGYIVDGVTNLANVNQNTGWREEQARLDEVHQKLNAAYFKQMGFKTWMWFYGDLVSTIFLCGFMALAAYGWKQGDVSTGQLAMTVGLSSSLFGALYSTMNLIATKFDDIGILRDALHKIATPLSVMDAADAPELKVDKGAVEFRNVDFSYVAGQPIFSGLNISIAAGQRVGVVGVSGAGKTTLCQLLLRAYDVTGGGVYIDGQNIAEVTQDSVHGAIAVIPQDPALFHRSLGDNIRYGRLSATDTEVRAAAQAAEAAPFIESLPEAYDTLVGERGVKLSGGQRQRIAIARAIVKDAPILVLDEATSALDSETEKSIQTAMLHAMEGRTTIVIAHRLSTLSHMDRIIVMDKGRIVEDGSFADLMALNGTFTRLWNLQAGGFLPDELPQ